MQDLLTSISLKWNGWTEWETVQDRMYHGRKNNEKNASFRCPNQIKPSPSAWKLWKKIIRSTFKLTSNFILPIELKLSNWIVHLDKIQMKHEWYFSIDSTEIYHRGSNNIERIFDIWIDNNNYEANEDSNETCERIPNNAIPITRIHNYKFQILTKFAFKLLTPREPNDFTKYI